MERREFIGLIGGAAATWPLAARAKQAGGLPIIGFLGTDATVWGPWTAAFVARLRELGWIEGRTVAIEYRWTEGRPERPAEFAAEFARLNADIIVTNSSSAPTVKQATSTIPIVFVLGNDPLGSGLVANLARPGGNVTGLSIQQTDIAGKRLQLLSEVVPRLRRSERFGQSFIVDNRPGAGSNIGTEIVVRAPANGYTLLLMTASNAINATVYDNLNFDLIRDVAPVASVGVVPFLMVVNPSFPAQTISEFIAYAEAHPAKINMGSAGYGSAPHVFGELFKMMTGIDLVHIPYRDSYWADLVAGQTQILFAPVISATGYVQSGQLRALAVTTRTRLETMPAIPALDEFVPGYEASGWLGVGAPKNTSIEIIDKLNNEINAALADAKAKSRLADVGVVLMPIAPDELGKFIAADTEKWAKVVKFAGIKLQ